MLKFRSVLIISVFCVILFCAVVLHSFSTVPVMSTNHGIELPVIMYHSILKDSELSGKYIITPAQLEDDIRYLEEHGYTTVSMQNVIDYVDNNKPLPEKPVMLTFDDGCYNNYEYALPILREHNAHGIFCIVGRYTDDFTGTNEANAAYGYMRWVDVYSMSVSGHAEIANHSYDFHKYGKDRSGSKKKSWESSSEYKKLFYEDTNRLQEGFSKNSVQKPIIYAYPFGAYSRESTEVLKEMGFRASFTCNEGINIITRDSDSLFLLKRNNRPDNIGTAEFFNELLEIE